MKFDLRWLVFATVAALPAYLIRFHIGPFPSTVLELFLIATITAWFISYRRNPIPQKFLHTWRWPIAMFLFAGIVSIFVSPNHSAALGLFRAYFIEPILFFFVCLGTLRSRRDLSTLVTVFSVLAIALGAYAIFQKITGFGIPEAWLVARRVTSVYPFPNAVGLFLAPLIPLFITFAIGFYEARRWQRIVWMFAAIMALVAIVLSQTVGAWVGVVVGLGFLLCVYRLRTFLALVVIAIIVAPFILVLPTAKPAIQKLTLHSWSGEVRRTQWSETLAMLRDRPFFGAGLGGYPAVFAPYHKAVYIEIFQYPHNILLNVWSELGVLGIVAFLWIFLKIFSLMIREVRKGGRKKSLLILGIGSSFLVILVHGLVDVPYFKNDLAITFWAFVMMASVCSTSSEIPPLPENHRMVG